MAGRNVVASHMTRQKGNEMSKITNALENEVAVVIANNLDKDLPRTRLQRAAIDKAFSRILKLIAPRIRHFIRQYGLAGHWEDAEQCCAIAVHRAILGYDPAKAQFTTFVNWQIRGELQGLRFRLMVDQRPSARKVAAMTVSMNGITSRVDGEEMTLESVIEDEGALERTEAAASDYLAKSATSALLDAFIQDSRVAAIEQLRRRPSPKRPPADPIARADLVQLRLHSRGVHPDDLALLDERLANDRAVVESRLFDAIASDNAIEPAVSKERARNIAKRAGVVIGTLARTDPRFALMMS